MNQPEQRKQRSRTESRKGTGSAIPAIQSAALNLGTAARDADNALECWDEEKWEDSVMWINNAIAQLESAREKIAAHASLPDISMSQPTKESERAGCSRE